MLFLRRLEAPPFAAGTELSRLLGADSSYVELIGCWSSAGFGLFQNSNPEAHDERQRWALQESEIDRIAVQQLQILEEASHLVRVGGRLASARCLAYLV